MDLSASATKARLSLEALETRAVPATFIVNSNGDDIPADVNVTTLREAITQANAMGGADTITFANNVSNIVFTAAQVPITDSLTIQGPGANALIINANNTGSAFTVAAAVANVAVNISGASITGTAGAGFGVAVTAANNPTLTLDSVEITGFVGGGVRHSSTGALAISKSTIAGNANTGVTVDAAAAATITSSTIGGNSGAGYAGSNGASMIVRNSTIVDNQTGINAAGTNVTLSSTIVARNTSSDVAAANFVGINNNNFIGIGTAALGGAIVNGDGNGNQVGTAGTPLNPNLQATLQNNGGPTRTFLPLAGSLVINKGAANGLTTDQRGIAFVGQADVGAAEFVPPPSQPPPNQPPPNNNPPNNNPPGQNPPPATPIQQRNDQVIANLNAAVFNRPITVPVFGGEIGAIATAVARADVNGDGADDIVAIVQIELERNGVTTREYFQLTFDGNSTVGGIIGTPFRLGSLVGRSDGEARSLLASFVQQANAQFQGFSARQRIELGVAMSDAMNAFSTLDAAV